MSMMGNIAIEGYIDELKKFLEKVKDQPPAEQIKMLSKKLEDDEKAAQGGWL